ncbi:MAG: tryptophan--tRNA ligase, partial [Methanophagales archaeon]|nr:tryptophan--tRNA ligase [Methanophagales archaeon]
HRDLDKWLDAYDNGEKVSVLSGRGPSEKMHTGHLTLYAIPKYFQDVYKCTVYIPVSDDEKFYVKEDLEIEDVERFANDNILDILAMGFDPNKTIVHKDFEHTRIYKYAAQVAKKITYSTAKAVFGLKAENNIGWVFYPAMQATHILYPQFIEGPHLTLVPIGIDQDPFIRATRDIAEKFGFQKPATIHKKLAPGLEGPKMSSSGKNAIWLSDDEDTVANKVHKYAFSGGQPSIKEHREKGGNPDIDVSFLYLKYFFEEDDNKLEQIARDYREGSLLTGELKEYFIEKVNNYLKEHRRRREIVAKSIDKYMLRD